MIIWNAVLLGLVQGIAEFLPISGSGHLAVLQNVFHMSELEGGHLFFDALLQLGALLAVCLACRRELTAMCRESAAFFRGPHSPERGQKRLPGVRLLFLLLVSVLPLFLVLPVHTQVEKLFAHSVFIGIAFLLTGWMLFAADRMQAGSRTEKTMRVRDALLIGLCQAVAVLPGISRLAATATAGVAAGLDRSFAVKFSLLMSIPAVLGANLVTILRALHAGVDAALLLPCLLGMAAAALSGTASLFLLRRIVRKVSFGGFSYYCWSAGLITILLSLIF